MEKNIKIWITKYALTQGIIEKDGIISSNPDVVSAKDGNCTSYYHKNEWFPSLKEAQNYAYEMKIKKLIQLDKKIKKVSAIVF